MISSSTQPILLVSNRSDILLPFRHLRFCSCMNEIVEAMKVVESCVVALSRLARPSLCKAHTVLPCLGACASLGPGEPPSLTQNPFGPPNRRNREAKTCNVQIGVTRNLITIKQTSSTTQPKSFRRIRIINSYYSTGYSTVGS
jgi:hypothetical protein